MNKKFCLALLLVCLTLIASFSGCANKEISFYIGTSETAENNTPLEPDKTVTVEQSKEKIENSKLVFNKNEDKTFDNMYLCFKGSSIKSVVAKSEKPFSFPQSAVRFNLSLKHSLHLAPPSRSFSSPVTVLKNRLLSNPSSTTFTPLQNGASFVSRRNSESRLSYSSLSVIFGLLKNTVMS